MLTNYYYQKLNNDCRNAYELILSALLNRDRECVLMVQPEAALEAWKAVVFDNPQIIYYPGLFSNPIQINGKVKFIFQYSQVDEQAFNIRLEEALHTIDSKLPWNATTYFKLKTIFDYIASVVKYEQKVLNEYLQMEAPSDATILNFMERNSVSFSPYGVLMNHRGVCQGISKLFKIFCDRFGLECAVLEAKTKDLSGNTECNHMMNVVEVDGIRAFVDVTNCLVMPEVPFVRYDSFLMSERVMNKSFFIPEDFQCVDENVNYYTRNGLRFTALSGFRQFLASYTLRKNEGKIQCHYDGENLTDEQLEDIFFELNNSHAEEGKQMQYASIKNGFCSGLLTDNEKLLEKIEKEIKRRKKEEQ